GFGQPGAEPDGGGVVVLSHDRAEFFGLAALEGCLGALLPGDAGRLGIVYLVHLLLAVLQGRTNLGTALPHSCFCPGVDFCSCRCRGPRSAVRKDRSRGGGGCPAFGPEYGPATVVLRDAAADQLLQPASLVRFSPGLLAFAPASLRNHPDVVAKRASRALHDR